MITAEHDVLRDESDRYAARLAEAGNSVVHHVVAGRDLHFLDGAEARRGQRWT